MLELRASEMCGLKSHLIHNGVERRPRLTALSQYRMDLGKASEALAVDRLRSQGHQIVHHDQAQQLDWSDGSYRMTGTPDDFLVPDASDGSHAQVVEQKLTSHANFTKVRRGLSHGLTDDRAGTLADYVRQGKRYAALSALNDLAVVQSDTRHPVDPTHVWLSVTDRDTCDQLFEPVRVFDTAWDDFAGYVRNEITTHMGDGSEEPPKPKWANPNHPKCEGCDFAYRCWMNWQPEEVAGDYVAFGAQWSDLTILEKAADADLKRIQSDKRALRGAISDKLKTDGLTRVDMGGFTASFGRSPVRFRADQDAMRADGVHDKYNLNSDVEAGQMLYIKKGKAK